MATKDVTAREYECDGCGKTFLVEEEDEPPFGYHGAGVLLIHGGGGTGCADWFACRERCIAKAVVAAIERADAR